MDEGSYPAPRSSEHGEVYGAGKSWRLGRTPEQRELFHPNNRYTQADRW